MYLCWALHIKRAVREYHEYLDLLVCSITLLTGFCECYRGACEGIGPMAPCSTARSFQKAIELTKNRDFQDGPSQHAS